MFQSTSQILVYKASAGSGKTYILTKEYVKLLFKNERNYRSILAVTFTNKASGEMKERIIQALFDLSSSSPKNTEYLNEICADFKLTQSQVQQKTKNILHEILHNYSFFYIETIDAFFQRVIRNFAKELGLHSYFGLEVDSSKIIHQAVQNLFLRLQENPEVQKWIVNFSESKIDEGKSKNIFKEIEQESAVLVKERFMDSSKDFVSLEIINEYFNSILEIITQFETQLIQLASKINEVLISHGLEISDFSGGQNSKFNIITKIKNKNFDYPTDAVVKCLSDTDSWFPKASKKRPVLDSLLNTEMPKLVNQLLDVICNEDGRKYRTAKLMYNNKFTIGLLQAVQNEIDLYCKDENIFLISNTNLLLRSIINESDAPFVYEKIGSFIKYLMIDEFQDTSGMQWQNFLPLIQNSLSEGGSSLVVGDVKQAIYRFRNGDWNLLQSKIYDDFPYQIQDVSLQTNWRSYANIIDFNNAFFKRFVRIIQDTFIVKMKESELALESELQEKMHMLYEDVNQEKPKSCKTGGEVQIVTIPIVEKESVEENTLLKVLERVVSLLNAGYKPQDIVFLCKGRKEIRLIVEFFNKQKVNYPQYKDIFSIISSEGMQLDSSSAIQFILAYLQWIETPKCKFSKSYLLTAFCIWKQKDANEVQIDAMSQFLELIGDKPSISRNSSLYQIVEDIIQTFGLNAIEEELAFIIDFQNLVYSYSKNNIVSISQFIEWWEEKSDKRYLQQEAHGFLRAMTIHKSKGLQFQIVIIPFASWDYEYKQSKTLFDTVDTDFSEIPIVSLNSNKDMAKTQFDKQFIQEKLQVYIDNLNVMYVACTRAVEGLYLYYSEKTTKAKISHEIIQAKSELIQDFPKAFENENSDFILGEISQKKDVASKTELLSFEKDYPVYSVTQKLLPNPEAIRFFDCIENKNKEQVFGIVMHKVLEFITTVDDIPKAVHRCFVEGIITESEQAKYISILQEKLQASQVIDWFNNSHRVLTEQAIMTIEGEKRPDRILIKDTNAIVIDYKFSNYKKSEYSMQVADYMKLLENMGYKTEGFIWYVLLNDIEKV